MRGLSIKQGYMLAISLLFAFCARLSAQYPGDPERYMLEPGSPAFATPEGVPNGFINLANGNLHIEIPIVNYPQRGKVHYVAKWVYDSRIWKVISTPSGYFWSPTNIDDAGIRGWRLMISDGRNRSASDGIVKSCVQSGVTYFWTETSNYRYQDMGGTSRKFPIFHETGVPCHAASNLTTSGPSLDGSGMWMNVTSGNLVTSVLGPDGTKLFDRSGACDNERMKDTNGNYVEQGVYGDPCEYSTFTDSLNRTLPASIIIPPGEIWYSYPLSFGANGTYKFKTVNKTGVGFGTEDENVAAAMNQTLQVMDSIVLADNTSYTFTYNSTGTLASMTLPTGATINFTYANFMDSAGYSNSFITTVVVDGQTTTYTPSICGAGCAKPPNCGSNCNKVVVRQPNNDETEHLFNVNRGAWLTQTKVFTGTMAAGTLLQTSNIDYENNTTSSVLGSTAFTRPIRTTTILPIVGTNLVKKSEMTWETFTYDYRGTSYTGTRGNVTMSKEFDFGSCASNCTHSNSGAELRRTVSTYLHTGNSNYVTTTSSNRNIINRVTNVQLQTPAGTKLTESITNYDNYTSPNQLVSVSGVTHHDTSAYGTSFTYRGNPTSTQVWTGGSNYLTTTIKYDITGQVVKITNPRGYETTYSYTDNYLTDNGSSNPPAYTPAPPTTNAFPTSSTSPLSGTVYAAYYYRTSAVAKSTDLNGNVTVTNYQDNLGRPTGTHLPTGALTSASYASAIQVNITTPTATAQANFNSLGKLSNTKLTNDPQGTVTTVTTYDPLGRVLTKTNPYRATTDPTYGITTYEYDGLSRVTRVTLPDNMTQQSYYGAGVTTAVGGRTTQLCASGTYGLGYPTMAKDEAGKKRQSWTNASGQLIEANEPDATGALTIATCYRYAPLGGLSQVDQGVQVRTNSYDSGLGRLITEVTPEGGTVNLYYTTAAGALCAANPSAVCRSTDARNITTTFTYDAEDRLISKSYSNGDPTVNYVYDLNCLNSSGSFVSDATCSGGLQLTNGKGRRVGLTDTSGLSAWKYNQLGQATKLRRKIGTITKDISYVFTNDGRIDSITYPSGHTVYLQYNSTGRIEHIGPLGTLKYVANVTYAPHGAPSTHSLGFNSAGFFGMQLASTYNNRLQPVNMTAKHTNNTVTLMDYTYSFLASSINDGHVKSVTNNLASGRSQTYTYDEMNRLLTAKTTATSGSTCWGQSYVYDRYANLSAINVPSGYSGCDNGPALSLTINSTNNKITNANFSYDAAGNLTASPVGYSYTWNAEGRMKTAVAGGVTYTYTYNGDGQRVKKAAASSSSFDKLYWFGLGGEVLAESDLSGNLTSEYIFMGATRIARRDVPSGNVYYFLGDRLGNARVVTNATGGIVEESDFLPYGTERGVTDSLNNNYKFTAHERDGETGLDHTLYRQHSSTLGRWLCPDRVRGKVWNPQSWNRYAYVENGPSNAIDPDGAETYSCIEGTTERWDWATESWVFVSRNVDCRCVNCLQRPGGNDAADEEAAAQANTNALNSLAMGRVTAFGRTVRGLAEASFTGGCRKFIEEDLGISVDDLQARAARMNVQAGVGNSTPLADLGIDDPGTVGDAFEDIPGLIALSNLNGYEFIFFNQWVQGRESDRGLALHELLHTFGKSDGYIAERLIPGYNTTSGGTDGISIALNGMCFQ